MTRLFILLLTAGILPGCSTQPRQGEEAAPLPHSQKATRSFSLGMTREQVRAELSDSWLFVSASRPDTGWSNEVSPPAGGRVLVFERSHPRRVEACDVYWVGHTNAPSMYFGKRLDYFYFDRDEKLIGFDWRILDY